MSDARWVCVRQRAGPLVKAFTTDNRAFLRRCYNDEAHIIKRATPAMRRTPVDRLELALALAGYDGIFYTLTFSDEYLPADRDGVQKAWDNFVDRLRSWRKKFGKKLDYYVYRIEGLHGDHRYHIHMFLRDQDFPPAVVRYLWGLGNVDDEPWTQDRVWEAQGYRCLAKYFLKEQGPVGKHAYGSARAMFAMLPPAEVDESPDAAIEWPDGVKLLPASNPPKLGQWGYFQYVNYLLPKQRLALNN